MEQISLDSLKRASFSARPGGIIERRTKALIHFMLQNTYRFQYF